MPPNFLQRFKQEDISKGVSIQNSFLEMLNIIKNPPGWIDDAFGKISGQGTEMDWARARFNKLTHKDDE